MTCEQILLGKLCRYNETTLTKKLLTQQRNIR